MTPELDIVIPVYNEGRNIVATLSALAKAVATPARVLICYDHAEDDTLPAIRSNPQAHASLAVEFVRNAGRGAHGAVMTGFAASKAPFVLMYAADDDYNAAMLDRMVALARGGCDIVCASRFMPGGSMVGCPLLKAVLVRAGNFTLRHLARLPTTDASNGFRLFSRRVIDQIAVESDQGFCYSIELLVKVHRLGWKIGEVPVQWFERRHGESRFRVLRWLPAYLRWYGYAFATTLLRRPPATVTRKDS
jgi:dolichol-phosphate mannosyltransferase